MKFSLLLLIAVPLVASAADEVPWTNASECIGRVCAVSGTVAEVKDDGAAIRLYFDKERHDVCVTLVRAFLVSWPDYAGRQIVANGLVRRFRDLTEVTVHDPSEIKLADAEPTPQIEFQSPEKEDVKELRDEIKRLEDRVKELESR